MVDPTDEPPVDLAVANTESSPTDNVVISNPNNDQTFVLSSPVISSEDDIIAHAQCLPNTTPTSGKTRRGWRWPLICKPRKLPEPELEPPRRGDPIKDPNEKKCKKYQKPFCCDVEGVVRQNSFGIHREYCLPYNPDSCENEMRPPLQYDVLTVGKFYCCLKTYEAISPRVGWVVPWAAQCEDPN